MRIKAARVVNYKSFLSTEWITFDTGLNIIVGQNNVGKTAFAEAVSLNFSNKPHRSLKTAPNPASRIPPTSIVEIVFEIERAEFLGILNSIGSFNVPKPQEPTGGKPQEFMNCIEDLNTVSAEFRGDGIHKSYLKSYGDIANDNCFLINVDQDYKYSVGNSGAQPNSQYGVPLADRLNQRIYFFRAERLKVSRSQLGASEVLAPDASNLPEVLLQMQKNYIRFDRFNKYVKFVFPLVQRIAVTPIDNNSAEIMVWTIDPNTERQDLAVPLAESGTGIGQVLAMLYVIMTADFPRAIVIDEPQSFLHPGAIRKLIEIFREYSQHQYIFTTHAPTAITSANPDVLLLVRMESGESVVQELDVHQNEQIGLFLAEIGARLSDVFGADNVLWVEGRTEETCFPIILGKVAKRPLSGTAIVGVVQVGDIDGRLSKTVFEIYQRLTTAGGLMPPATGFIFDREGRTEREREDLIRQSQSKVAFTPRRLFENYLLNSGAISDVVNMIEGFSEQPVTATHIDDWIEQNRWNRKYFDTTVPDLERTSAFWLREVHAANFLNDLFCDLSEERCRYSKTEHGLALTLWISNHSPDDLKDLSDLIVGKLAN